MKSPWISCTSSLLRHQFLTLSLLVFLLLNAREILIFTSCVVSQQNLWGEIMRAAVPLSRGRWIVLGGYLTPKALHCARSFPWSLSQYYLEGKLVLWHCCMHWNAGIWCLWIGIVLEKPGHLEGAPGQHRSVWHSGSFSIKTARQKQFWFYYHTTMCFIQSRELVLRWKHDKGHARFLLQFVVCSCFFFTWLGTAGE